MSSQNSSDPSDPPDSLDSESTAADAPSPIPSHRRQIALQMASALLVLSLAWPYFLIRHEALPWLPSSLAIGLIALIAALLTRQAWWWCVIHAAFAPLAYFILSLAIDPRWFLLAFFLLFLIYRGAASGQIPLYLSNRSTAEAVGELLNQSPGRHFLDLGAGIGSLIRPLAKAFPQHAFTGVENAPATWFAGYVLTKTRRNIRWCYGDLWKINLADYDLVYCFLSPAPMAALAQKAQHEMRPGSRLISNSFAIPDKLPFQVIELDDARSTQLFIYQF